MTRTKRKYTVAVATTGFVSLFMAWIGIPLLGVLFWPPLNSTGDMQEVMIQSFRVAEIVSVASIFCLLLAAGCFVYVFAVLAIMFIGLADKAERESGGAIDFNRPS